jgi:hypothetical protein
MFVPRWLVGLVFALFLGLLGLSVVAQGVISPSRGRGDLQHRWISWVEGRQTPTFGFHAFKDTASNYTCYVFIQSDSAQMECVK